MSGTRWVLLAAAGLTIPLVAFAVPGAEPRLGEPLPTKAERPSPTLVSSTDDLFGCLMRTSGEPFQILEAQFGLTAAGDLGFSQLTILDHEGRVLSEDRAEHFSYLFNDVSRLEGFWIDVGSGSQAQRLWVDEFEFYVDQDGYFEVDYDHGVSASGQVYFLQGTCEWKSRTVCGTPPGCDSCGDPPFCLCTSGSPNCQAFIVTACERICPDLERCETFVVIPPIGFPFLICGCD